VQIAIIVSRLIKSSTSGFGSAATAATAFGGIFISGIVSLVTEEMDDVFEGLLELFFEPAEIG
jgi:hypothetical protein